MQVSVQQENTHDCGLYTIRNAELLSRPQHTDWYNGNALDLRQYYLKRVIDFAIWSKHNLILQRSVYDERRPQRIKRSLPSDFSQNLSSSRRKCAVDWEPPSRIEEESRYDWIISRETLVKDITDPSFDDVANLRRAEHLLRMIDAIASDEVLESWKAVPMPYTQKLPGSSPSAANAIYSLVSRGQSRSFRDNAILRVGKYLFASRILHRVDYLRSLGAPSKQPVATAGSTGEGNAVTRALKGFVHEVYHDISQDVEDREIRKCKQWWNDGKIWKMLADAIDPAILLLIPSGQKTADTYRFWDSE